MCIDYVEEASARVLTRIKASETKSSASRKASNSVSRRFQIGTSYMASPFGVLAIIHAKISSAFSMRSAVIGFYLRVIVIIQSRKTCRY